MIAYDGLGSMMQFGQMVLQTPVLPNTARWVDVAG